MQAIFSKIWHKNKNPPLNEFKDGKKIAMKKKINIGFPISNPNIRFLFRNQSF